MEAFLKTQKLIIRKYFVRTDNPRYLGEKQNIIFSQNLPNMGGENCKVLGLRLMHKLAMSHIYLLTSQYLPETESTTKNNLT